MTAMDTRQRSAKTAAKRKAAGEESLSHQVSQTAKDALLQLMRWHGITEQADALQRLVMNAGDELPSVFPAAGPKVKIRHHLRAKPLAKLKALAGTGAMSSAIERLILGAHALGQAGSALALESERHKIRLRETWRQAFQEESLLILRRDPGDEIIAPAA